MDGRGPGAAPAQDVEDVGMKRNPVSDARPAELDAPSLPGSLEKQFYSQLRLAGITQATSERTVKIEQ